MATAASLIAQALIYLSASNKWCKKANARNAQGKSCSPLSTGAVTLDLYGALLKAKATLPATQKNLNDAMKILRLRIVGRNKDIDSQNDKMVFSGIASFLAP